MMAIRKEEKYEESIQSFFDKKKDLKQSCSYWKKDVHNKEHCWKLHPEQKPKQYQESKRKPKGKKEVDQTTQQNHGPQSKHKTRMLAVGMRSESFPITSAKVSKEVDLKK